MYVNVFLSFICAFMHICQHITFKKKHTPQDHVHVSMLAPLSSRQVAIAYLLNKQKKEHGH